MYLVWLSSRLIQLPSLAWHSAWHTVVLTLPLDWLFSNTIWSLVTAETSRQTWQKNRNFSASICGLSQLVNSIQNREERLDLKTTLSCKWPRVNSLNRHELLLESLRIEVSLFLSLISQTSHEILHALIEFGYHSKLNSWQNNANTVLSIELLDQTWEEILEMTKRFMIENITLEPYLFHGSLVLRDLRFTKQEALGVMQQYLHKRIKRVFNWVL